VTIAERCVGRDQQSVALPIKRNCGHPTEWFIVKISEAGIDLEIFQMRENLARCARQDGELNFGMPCAKRRGQSFDHRQSGRDCGQTYFSGETMLESVHLLAHGAGVANDASRPIQNAFAFRSETLEAGAAVDQQHTEAVFQLFHTGRQRGLGDPTGLGGSAKMLFPGQSEQKFQFFEQWGPRLIAKTQ